MSRVGRLRSIVALAVLASAISSISPTLTVAHDSSKPRDGVIGPGGAPPAGSGPVDVAGFVRAIDGDTMEAWINGSRVGIGLIGVDAPEGNTVCGVAANNALQGMLFTGVHLDEDDELVFDARMRRMYYGFTPDGQAIAEALVGAGVALATGEGRDADALQALEDDAREAGRGCLWNGEPNDFVTAGYASTVDTSTRRSPLALPSGFQAQVAVGGLNFPTDFEFLPDGRILVAEKNGVVRIAESGSLLPTPFIDLRPQVNDYWDRGLLGVAADPNFASNGYVYFLFTYEHDPTNYSGPKTGRLIRVTATGNTAAPASAVVVLGVVAGDTCDDFPAGADCIPSDGPSHSTGGMRFASDGALYVTLGEGANFNAESPQALRAQDLDSLGGKLVRITTSGQGVPGNPFWTGNPNDVRSKIWALGFRNAYRFSLRPGSDVPYVGDVGWVTWEEVNVATAGANLGWPCYEGVFQQAAYSSYPVCQQLYGAGTAVPPIIAWDHSTGGSAVTGGVFYTGTAYPSEYHDAYFYGDYARSFIRYAEMSAGDQVASGPFEFESAAGGPVAFEMGPDGNLYYLSINSGEVRRIVYQGAGGGSESGYVSDMAWAGSTNGWGPPERDMSNGEQAAGDGGPLTIDGAVFAKGVGVHAPSEIVIALDGTCSQFISSVGVDDEVGPNGSVVFEVYSGADLLTSSGVLTGADGPATLNVSLTGVIELQLVVTDAGDNIYWDHANWADAWIECGQDQTPPTIVSTSPVGGATGVPVSTTVTATFSEAIVEATLAGNVTLAVQGGDAVPAAISYSASTATVTLTPNASLAVDTTYTVTITGGPDGVTDTAGNPLPSDATWTFTTAGSAGAAPVITSPLASGTFIVGDQITYSGYATDDQGEELPAGALRWRIIIHHCNHIDCHAHQVIDETGTLRGSFTVPDHGDQFYFEIKLTATSNGLSNTTAVEIHPETVAVTLLTSPAGLNVNLAGEEAAEPLTRPIVAGSVITVAAPSPQGDFTFASWSDGGARVHTVAAGSSDLTLTAAFSGGGAGEFYLSDLDWVSATNGWGPVERDMSNGEQAAGDGGPLTIGGVVYGKGIGTHAHSEVVVALDGSCSTFSAVVGVDDEVGSNGSVRFEVWGDGILLASTGVLTGASPGQALTAGISGVTVLRLVVTDGSDNIYWDHANWADAKVLCGSPGGDTTPPSVISVSPLAGETGVPAGATVTATFSEAIAEATLSGNLTLAVQGGGAVPAALSYDATTRTATLTPSAALAPDTTYVATISGEPGGVADLAGNPLAADEVWSFTTTAGPGSGGDVIYISDMTWVSESNGWGSVERDMSNGEQAAGDGGPLTIGGVVYGKGIGTHAHSEVVIALNGSCTTFAAMAGIDDEVGPNGSVIFKVFGDGTLLHSSPLLRGTDGAHAISVDVSGRGLLRLIVTDGGDNIYWDHANWADARLICDGSGGGPGDQRDTMPPTVVSTSPPGGATGVGVDTAVSATFSEPVDQGSLASAITITGPAGGIVPANLGYDAATLTVTLTPPMPLAESAAYEVRIRGGSAGVTDLAGNAMSSDVVWLFTTGASAVPRRVTETLPP